MAAGAGRDVRPEHIKSIHVLEIGARIVLYDLHWLKALSSCLPSNLVFAFIGIVREVSHVGDVLHVANPIAHVLQITAHYVKGEVYFGMSNVSVSIDSRAADIHTHKPLMDGDERLLLSGKVVVDPQ